MKQKFKRKERKIDSLSRIIRKLEKNKIVSNHAAEILYYNFSGLTLELLKSELKSIARTRAYELEIYFRITCSKLSFKLDFICNCSPEFLGDLFTFLQSKTFEEL